MDWEEYGKKLLAVIPPAYLPLAFAGAALVTMIVAFLNGEHGQLDAIELITAFVFAFSILLLLCQFWHSSRPSKKFSKLWEDVADFVPGENQRHMIFVSGMPQVPNCYYDDMEFPILIDKLKRFKISLPERNDKDGWNRFLPRLLVCIEKKELKRAKTLWSEMQNSNSR